MIEAIHIGPSDALAPVDFVRAVAGCGLEGDRHFRADGQRPGGALTLIEAEALEEVGLAGAQSRRQIVVRGASGSARSSASASSSASRASTCRS